MSTHNYTMELSRDHHSRNMSETATLIAGPYMVTLASFGILENSFVLLTFARHKALLNNSNNLLVMFLSVCDLLMSTVSFPFIAASSVANRWLFSTLGCHWYAASMTCLGLTSISLLTCIALERYIVIALKLRESHSLATQRARRLAIACFIWGTIIAVCPLVGWGSYDLEPVFPSCTPVWWKRDPNNLSFVTTIFTTAFFLPVCVITFAYIMIFKKVRERQNSSPMSSSHEIRVAVISLAMIVFFLLSWGPYALVALLQTFSESFYVPDILNIIPVMMAKSSVMWNPIIYLGRNRQFLQAFKDDIAKIRSSFKRRNAAILPFSGQHGNMKTGPSKVVSVAPSSSIKVYDYETCI